MFIKGASLSMLAFGNLGMSASQDIDLLSYRGKRYRRLSRSCRALVTDALILPLTSAMRGCGSLCDSAKDLGFVHQTTRFPIELRWQLFFKLARHGGGFGHGGVAGRVLQRDGWTANAG